MNLASGVTVGTADFSNPGTASITAAGPLNISNQLKFSAASATLTGASNFVFTPSGSNVNTASPAGTLTLSGGVLALGAGTAGSTATAGAAININYIGAYTQNGPAPDIGNGTTVVWNTETTVSAMAMGFTSSLPNLLNSAGSATGASYFATNQVNGLAPNGGANQIPLLKNFTSNNGGPMSFVFGGLTAGTYNLYALANTDGGNVTETFSVTNMAGTPSTTITTINSGIPPAGSGVNLIWSGTASGFWREISNVTPTSGSIDITVANGVNGATRVCGFELVPLYLSAPLSLPTTNIATTLSSTLDFNTFDSPVTLGGLNLGGNLTVQDGPIGSQVTFGGDVVSTSNASLLTAAGSGSVPALTLAGNSGGIQNIYAANGTTLTLPVLAISAGTVNVGNAAGFSGNVLLGACDVAYGRRAP